LKKNFLPFVVLKNPKEQYGIRKKLATLTTYGVPYPYKEFNFGRAEIIR